MASSVHSKGAYRHEEFQAGESGIYPGMLVELNSSGYAIKHATQGGRGLMMIADEDALQGNTVSTVFTSGDQLTCMLPEKGAEVRLLVAAGENIAIGDELISNGAGLFIENGSEDSGTTVNQVFAIAAEAQDLSDSGDSNTLVRAIVL